jgi:hypothetical protein
MARKSATPKRSVHVCPFQCSTTAGPSVGQISKSIGLEQGARLARPPPRGSRRGLRLGGGGSQLMADSADPSRSRRRHNVAPAPRHRTLLVWTGHGSCTVDAPRHLPCSTSRPGAGATAYETSWEVLGPRGAGDLERHGPPSGSFQALAIRHRAGPQACRPPVPADERHQVSVGHVDAQPVHEPRRARASAPGARPPGGGEGGAPEGLRSIPWAADPSACHSRTRASPIRGATEKAPSMRTPPASLGSCQQRRALPRPGEATRAKGEVASCPRGT